ncbi:MAG TPA: helix-turn-helix transcriptional regulator [Lacunisphaera sp.]|nr:helix-turn-helix transcriptional regulator [Lacunisphaera sp.]
MSDELSQAFGKVLRREREKKKWSQMQLAQEAGLHLNTLGKLESGKRTPNLHTVFAVSRALGISAGKFISMIEWTEEMD